jgi:hypothetical protein
MGGECVGDAGSIFHRGCDNSQLGVPSYRGFNVFFARSNFVITLKLTETVRLSLARRSNRDACHDTGF